MFKALLLAVWHDLSDVKLAEALEDRASFRRFCGFSASEPTPERTTFVRFRRALIAHGLDRTLFETVTADLKAKSVKVKTGTLVDATIIASASEQDGNAHWVKHKKRPAVHGFKAHVGADASTSLVEKVWITPANVHDGHAGPEALPDDPGEVFADSAYRGSHFGDAVRGKGGTPQPKVRSAGGRALVSEAEAWGELWRQHQDRYFAEHGLELRVDATAAHPGEHIGPVRMRKVDSPAAARAEVLRAANEPAARDPEQVLATLTRNNASFSERDLDRYLAKHLGGGPGGTSDPETARDIAATKGAVLGHGDVLALHHRETGEAAGRFTTIGVRQQERQALVDGAALAKAARSRRWYRASGSSARQPHSSRRSAGRI